MIHEWARYLWWSCQSPVAHSFGLLNHLNSFHGGMFKLHTKFDADPLVYAFSHFQYDSHTVHMLTQWCLPPPLANTVKVSLFTYVHSSPLSLTARLHECVQTVHVILTMLGLFLDYIYIYIWPPYSPGMCMCVYVYTHIQIWGVCVCVCVYIYNIMYIPCYHWVENTWRLALFLIPFYINQKV